MQFEGAVLWKGDEGYEQARQAAVWNVRKPDRYPGGHRPGAVRAGRRQGRRARRERGLRVKARAGGHAWSGSSVRSGMLIDLSRAERDHLRRGRRYRRAQPGVKGRDLNAPARRAQPVLPVRPLPVSRHRRLSAAGRLGLELARDRPGLHEHRRGRRRHRLRRADPCRRASRTPTTGGRRAAPAAVTSASSPASTCAATRARRATYTRTDVYSLDDIDAVLSWALEFEPTQPPEFEFAILGTTPTLPDGRTVHDGTALMLMCQALMYDDDEARAALWRVSTSARCSTARCTGRRRERSRSPSSTTAPTRSSPRACAGRRTACGPTPRARSCSSPPSSCSATCPRPSRTSSGTRGASSSSTTPRSRCRATSTSPPSPAGMTRRRTTATSPGRPLTCSAWSRSPRESSWPMRTCASARRGSSRDENAARLEQLRAEHDPDGRFHSYLTTDEESW